MERSDLHDDHEPVLVEYCEACGFECGEDHEPVGPWCPTHERAHTPGGLACEMWQAELLLHRCHDEPVRARIDTTGSIATTLDHLYGLLVDWHVDEATDRAEAAVYARRFVLRLLGHRDGNVEWSTLIGALPSSLRREIARIETDYDWKD